MPGISTEEIYRRSFGSDDHHQVKLKNKGEVEVICDSIFAEIPPLKSIFVGWSQTNVSSTELIECAYDVKEQNLPRVKFLFSLAMIENPNLDDELKNQIIGIIFS